MSSIPETSPVAEPMESIETRFRRLEADWIAQTGFLSSSTQIINHPAFQAILKLGEAVVPLMLRDLEERPRLWVWALPRITGVDPVPVEDRGNIGRMSAAWLNWGRANGYQW